VHFNNPVSSEHVVILRTATCAARRISTLTPCSMRVGARLERKRYGCHTEPCSWAKDLTVGRCLGFLTNASSKLARHSRIPALPSPYPRRRYCFLISDIRYLISKNEYPAANRFLIADRCSLIAFLISSLRLKTQAAFDPPPRTLSPSQFPRVQSSPRQTTCQSTLPHAAPAAALQT
jgi:hypothetical protein